MIDYKFQKTCPHCQVVFQTNAWQKIFCCNKCKARFWDKEHSRLYKLEKKTRSVIINNCRLCNQECRNFERSDPLCKKCKLKVLRRKQMSKSIETEDILRDDHERMTRKVGHLDKHGYVMISGIGHPNAEKGGRIREHILIMANHLGRPLKKHENVHHKNGVRDDNRLENLELWSTSQPSGQRKEDKVEWAKSFLKEYGYTIIEK